VNQCDTGCPTSPVFGRSGDFEDSYRFPFFAGVLDVCFFAGLDAGLGAGFAACLAAGLGGAGFDFSGAFAAGFAGTTGAGGGATGAAAAFPFFPFGPGFAG
jgi:hypothetical protein